MKYLPILILLFFLQSEGFANPKVIQTEGNLLLQDNQISTFTDYSNSLPFSKVKNFKNVFRHASAHFPDFGFSNQTHWLKFTLQNRTQENNIFIKVNNPNLNWLRLYYPVNNKGNYKFVEGGNLFPASQHRFGDQDNIFSVPLPMGQTRTFFLKIKSYSHIAVPISAGSQEQIVNNLNIEHWRFGLFFGAILIILLFNFVIYLVLKDKVYLYYVLYIFFLGFFLFSVYGYGYKFFWSNQPFLTLQSISIPKILMGITMVLFLRQFLQTRKTLPLLDTIGNAILILCIAIIPLSLFGLYNISLILIDIFLLIICVVYFIAGIKLSKQGFKPAKYFMLAWSILFIGLFIDIFKDMNIISYTHFTRDAFFICADIEMILLSFALADKINIYKAGEISAEKKALKLAQEKEQLIALENVRLETKVKNRTLRLTKTNEKLEEAMSRLQSTHNKLVHAEKLASIGKLTAGIAHEINNPISYIKTNVSALRKDINDLLELIGKYQKLTSDNISEKMKEIENFINEIELDYIKKEITTLIDGIKEGVSHTSEIVLGLRKFSRMDEGSFEKMNVHETLDSALRFVKSTIPSHIEIVKDYDNIGNIDSSPGPLCQVFVNILTNGIQAITLKENSTSEKEKITITTKKAEKLVEITIADTGPGICEEHQMNIFDPFFTTKEVGEGTGLGLSISYGIIKKLNGNIRVSSSPDKGTAFTIVLPTHHTKEVVSG